MVCPKCQANVANDPNFCPRCGTPFKNRNGFVANLWRDNKPGFLILSFLLVAMLGSIGYYLYSRTGKFVVTIESVSKDEAIDFYTKAALEVYCREFAAECQSGKLDAMETEIKRVIPGLFRDNAGGYARITYYNGTGEPITATRFKYRQPPESWRVGNTKNYYQPKIDRLRKVSLQGGNLPFEHRVDLALTIATVEHSVPFMLQSGESKIWCLVNETANRERQIEYAQDGKTYETAVLRQNQT
jgi:hypothetical protein